VPPEDPGKVAEAIKDLYFNPARFLSMSVASAKRVRSQSAAEMVIGRELELASGGERDFQSFLGCSL